MQASDLQVAPVTTYYSGTKRTNRKAQLMRDFNKELKSFQNHMGMFDNDYIWRIVKGSVLVVAIYV